MDLDAAMDQLYGLPRERFVAERDKLAKSQPALADQVRKLRKPTVAAWQANQLARKRPKDVAALVELGEKMRVAQETLNGPELRELSRRRAALLDKLVGWLPDVVPGLRDLLERSITEPSVAEDLLAGRLVTMPEGGGWGFGDAVPTSTPPPKSKRDEEARRAVAEAEAAEAAAQRALEAAEDELRSRAERVERLQAELAEAREARDAATATVKQARQEAQRRTKSLREAEQRLGRS